MLCPACVALLGCPVCFAVYAGTPALKSVSPQPDDPVEGHQDRGLADPAESDEMESRPADDR